MRASRAGRGAARPGRTTRARTAGTELTAYQPFVRLEPLQLLLDRLALEAEAPGDLPGRERAVRLREAGENGRKRIGSGLQESVRQPAGRNDAEGVPIEPRVLRGEQDLVSGEPHADRAALADERLREAGSASSGRR